MSENNIYHNRETWSAACQSLVLPAKGDKWDTIWGNLWAWDQFGRQSGGVKLHVLLIEEREWWVIEIYRCLGLLWKRREKPLVSCNRICEVASGRIGLLSSSCHPQLLLPFYYHLTQISGSLYLLSSVLSLLTFPTYPPTSLALFSNSHRVVRQ